MVVNFDGQGRVAVQDRRSGTLHVFGADGREQLVCAPSPGELREGDDIWNVVGAPDGRLFAQTDTGYDRWLAFAADGARMGWTELGGPLAAFASGADAAWAVAASSTLTRLRRIDLENPGPSPR